MSPELDSALKRLKGALAMLEESAATRRPADLETELQLMQDDRARLSVELESATARLSRVEAATQHVGLRVHAAMGALGQVLARADRNVSMNQQSDEP
ncbi:MAG: hypothetical protein JWR08_1263 [Enterovirga sp.]|nr:hypothetical protein [Enterovirga sp.]